MSHEISETYVNHEQVDTDEPIYESCEQSGQAQPPQRSEHHAVKSEYKNNYVIK